MDKFNKEGVAFCRLTIGLCTACFIIGIAFLVFAPWEAKFYGAGMVALGAWGSLAMHFILSAPDGIIGWRSKFVTAYFENAIRRDFLFPNRETKEIDPIHAGKRFVIFSFVCCLFLGFFELSYWIPSVGAGLLAALIYEGLTRGPKA